MIAFRFIVGLTLSMCFIACTQVSNNQDNTTRGDGGENQKSSSKLRVAAAANLRFVLKDLKADFEQINNEEIEVIYASSGKLCSRISNGAPFDVFLSANMKFPRVLVKEDLTANEPVVYARGALILWSTTVPDFKGGMKRMLDDDIDKIAVATDKNAPYGEAALQALKSSGIYDKIVSKLVYGESVSQVNQYVMGESVAIGITNKSVVFGKLQGKGIWFDIDTSLYTPIDQGIVITKYGAQNHPTQSQLLQDYLFSESAQEIFTKYGYLAP
ncbi:MAG: molybdate ABC transporter substrate-binding protein [Flavobacteriales bacterium]|nr:molybdate ABC transporter substrate-binding protein [Flavobacteriales bacterium]